MVAQKLKCSFVPVRKQGKLGGEVVQAEFSKEYGAVSTHVRCISCCIADPWQDVMEMQKASIIAGHRVVILDDLIATGGTLQAATELVRKLGGIPVAAMVIVELAELNVRPTQYHGHYFISSSQYPHKKFALTLVLMVKLCWGMSVYLQRSSTRFLIADPSCCCPPSLPRCLNFHNTTGR